MNAFRFGTRRFLVGAGGSGAVLAAVAAALPFFSQQKNDEKKKNSICVPYLLVGGGTAAYFAALTIRARDPEARVLIVSDETESPYNRQLLSKELWWYGDSRTSQRLSFKSLASGRWRDAHYEVDGFYPSIDQLIDGEFPHGAVALLRNAPVSRIDVTAKFAELSNGQRIEFEKCLIATGSNAKTVPQLDYEELKNFVTVFKNVDDYRRLHEIMEGGQAPEQKQPKHVAILGGGLLGTELSYSLLRRYGHKEGNPIKFYQITPDNSILTEILPPLLSEYATEQMHQIGVDMQTNCEIKSAKILDNNRIELVFKRNLGKEEEFRMEFDHVIVDADTEPNVDVAKNSNLPLDEKLGGLKADAYFQVADSIWAAGNVCAFEDKILRRRRRLEHWENAQTTGRIAGENMTGGQKTYTHQSAFETIFGSMEHIHAVGEIDARSLQNVTYMIRPSNDNKVHDDGDQVKAVVFYFENEKAAEENELPRKRILGILMLNVFSSIAGEMARKIICDAKAHSDDELNDLVKLLDVFGERDSSEKDRIDELEDDAALGESL